MYFALENNKLNLPYPCRLPLAETDKNDPHRNSVPFVFVADNVFLLTRYCTKPYGRKNMTDAQRIFDYRLFWKCRVTENPFGTLVNRFRVFSVQNNLSKNNVSIVVLVSLLLQRPCATYTPSGFTDEIQMDGNICNGTWHDEASSEFLCPLETTKLNRYSKNAGENRTTFKDYFCGPDEVPWQWQVLL